MTRTVIALYDDFASANAAVRELVDNGFSRDDISLMANDASGEYGRYLDTQGMPNTGIAAATDVTTNNAAAGAGVGAGIGAVVGGLGGLLIGLGALVIPGIGPVLAAGPLAAALTGLAGAGAGAVAGGVTGGLIGALADMGVPHETAEYYAEGIRRGGTLLSIRSPENMTQHAVDILNHHNAVDINERVQKWRQGGWTGYDPNAKPVTTNQGMTGTDRNDVNRRMNENVTASTDMPVNTTDKDFPKDSLYRTENADRDVTREAYQDADLATHYADFNTYDQNFRNHFANSMVGTGYTYEQYQPAYRYGYDLATNDRFHGKNWDEIEPEAERYWDERNPGTWNQIKAAVHHAWDEIRNSVS